MRPDCVSDRVSTYVPLPARTACDTTPPVQVCTKWSKVCPAKTVPASYVRKDEFWVPMDEDSWKMRNMEKTMNRMTQKHKTQAVK